MNWQMLAAFGAILTAIGVPVVGAFVWNGNRLTRVETLVEGLAEAMREMRKDLKSFRN